MDGKIHSKFELDKTDGMEVNAGLTRKLSLKIARVSAVNTDKNTMDLEWLYPYKGGANNVEIGSPYIGLRSGIRFTPEIGSILVVGYAKDKIVPLSYILPSSYENLLGGEKDSSGDRTFIKLVNPGDINLRSSRGAEISLEDQVFLGSKNGDSISINPNTGDIYFNSLNLNASNEAGNIRMGQVTRTANGKIKIITDDGLEVTDLNGGNALNELKINIKEFSDNSILNSDVTNTNLAEVTLGTLVDTTGQKLVNQAGNQIVCDIKLSSGARIQVDKSGKININEGNMLKPTDVPEIPGPLEQPQSVYNYSNVSQQRAAREGDRVMIPITTPLPSTTLDHPGLIEKAAFNMQQMVKFASSLQAGPFPVIFKGIPPDIKLMGEITQGADGVFIGSLDKTAELIENKKNQ